MAASDIQANLSKGGTNVDILIQGKKGIEHNFDKQLIVIAFPKQNPPLTWIVDLQRLKEVITVNGYLEDTDSESSLTKKESLRTLLQSAGTFTLVWGTGAKAQSYDGNVVKCGIKEVNGAIGDEGSQGKISEIILQFVIGTFRG